MYKTFRTGWKIARYNFSGWRKNPRIWIAFILTFVMCYLLTDKAVVFSIEHGSILQILEPFVWTFGDSNSILLSSLLLLLLLSDMPYLSAGTPFYLMRTDRKTWIAGQVMYTMATVFLYMAFILVSSALLCMSNAFSGNKWSQTAAILGYSGDGSRIALPAMVKTLEKTTPYVCALNIFGLMLGYALVMALIMLVFNVKKGYAAGVVSSVLFTVYGFLMDPERIAKIFNIPQELKYKARVFCGWASPLNQATYHMHNFGYDELPRLWMTFLIFAVLIAVLIVLAVRAVRRYNFNFRGSED